jgi:hypothetical protein
MATATIPTQTSQLVMGFDIQIGAEARAEDHQAKNASGVGNARPLAGAGSRNGIVAPIEPDGLPFACGAREASGS